MNIELININKSFQTPAGEVEVFRNLNLCINTGEFVSILAKEKKKKSMGIL